ncbi:hypothetical protein KIW84_013879 [Lathyrus oleraceus]|uniref:Retrovirus-related Pol polyprotein from transposon TNT 1-94 n=1 Tax=Pisum sativum TaxID=3888 RepID=A0A9D5BLK6_PEA|nr:hypothetical protein KIW84_013879 [Pisum sativum]
MLVGYTDLDLSGSLDDQQSTSGYMMSFVGGVVAWQSQLQKCVALSTIEAEFIIIVEASKELLWLRKIVIELGVKQEKYQMVIILHVADIDLIATLGVSFSLLNVSDLVTNIHVRVVSVILWDDISIVAHEVLIVWMLMLD